MIKIFKRRASFKRKILTIGVFFATFLFAGSAYAATFTASSNGFWNIGTTWGGGCSSGCTEGTDYPGPNDVAVISSRSVTLDANQNVGSTTISGAGSLTLGSNTLNVYGNFTNTGTFVANTGTVNLKGTNQYITGTSTFYNLTKTVTSADTLNFGLSTTTISHALTLSGTPGNLLTVRGNEFQYSSQVGTSSSQGGVLEQPSFLATDAAGDVFVTDSNARFQEFNSSGNFVAQFGGAGSGNGQFAVIGGVTELPSIAIATSSGDIFISDPGNNRIQEFSSSGTYITQFGSSGTGAGQLGSQSAYELALALDPAGQYLYVADLGNHRVDVFSATSTAFIRAFGWGVLDGGSSLEVCTVSCQSGSAGSGAGELGNNIGGIVAGTSTVYVADASNFQVTEFTLGGSFIVSLPGSSGDNFFSPYGLALDSSGDLFVSEYLGNEIQEFSSNLTFIRKWGSAGTGNSQFSGARGVAVDPSGNIYAADSGNNRIEKFSSSGTFVTQFGISSVSNGVIDKPYSVAVDSLGNIYADNSGNTRIEKFNSSGAFVSNISSSSFYEGTYLATSPDATYLYAAVTYLRGIAKFNASSGALVAQWGGTRGSLGGQFESVGYIAVDPSGNIYATDPGNNRFQKFDSSGNFIFASGYGVADGASSPEVCTVASTCETGQGTTAPGGYFEMSGISVSPDGSRIYVSDSYPATRRVSVYDSNGNYLYQFGSAGSGNGQFEGATDLSTDAVGHIYVADAARVQQFDPSDNYISQFGSSGDGFGQFNDLNGLAVNSVGQNLYTSDYVLDRILDFHTLWNVSASSATVNTSYLTVQDSSNANSTISCLNCTNNGGNTNWSFSSASVPGAPTSVTAATSSPNLATVSFSAPVSNGGSPVLYYMASSTPGNIIATSTASPITVFNLTNGVSYSFKVYAVNQVGTSSPSTASNSVTPTNTNAAPALFTLAATSIGTTSAVLNGQIISDGNASSTARGFVFGTTTAYGATTTQIGTFGVGTFSTTTTGLLANTLYHFKAYATNSIGTGYGTDQIFTTSSSSIPDAPTGVTAASSSAGQVLVTFTPTVNNGGSAVLYYVASSSPGGAIAISTSTSITVKGLTNGTPYTFQVYAVNSVGTSTASMVSNPITPFVLTSFNPYQLTVTGTTTPDVTGIYVADGSYYNGDAVYTRQSDSAYYIWHASTIDWAPQWDISAALPSGSIPSGYLAISSKLPIGAAVAGGSYSGSADVEEYDPNTPQIPIIPSIPTPATPPTQPAKIEITESITSTSTPSPDPTGLYDLSSTTYNGEPVYEREDGQFYIWGQNAYYWDLTKTLGDTTAGAWEWNYFTIPGGGDDGDTNGNLIYPGSLNSYYDDPNFPTPGEYLDSLQAPTFKADNTLPMLSKYGWPYSYQLNQAMASWGYALDFGVVSSSTYLTAMTDPTSVGAKLIALAQSNPSLYKLDVSMDREYFDDAPASVDDHDSSGDLISPPTISPAASSTLIADIAASTTQYIQQIQNLTPISLILNGGERGMGVFGNESSIWTDDPAVVSAMGTSSWSDYQSEAKFQQETPFTNDAHAASNNALYVYYPIGGNPKRNTLDYGDWWEYDWDYQFTQSISDLPSAESYYKGQNQGWVSPTGDDALTFALNAVGYATTFGKTLSYNWVNGGYSNIATSTALSPINEYYGFLKSYYVAGMIGGNAGYYVFPTGGFDQIFDKNAPPHWLQQVEALGQVQAEFSYLEDIERNGDLLPGSMNNLWTSDQPAYEFWTGFYDTRVLARKMNGQKRWLISAWAADGVPRTVSVTIPELGTISLTAEPATSLYDARIVNGSTTITEIDNGSETPTPLALPTGTPDSDGPVPTVALSASTHSVTLGNSVTLTAAPSNLAAAASSTKFLANNALVTFNYASPSYVWTPTATGTYAVDAVVGDTAGDYVVSATTTITVNAPALPDTTPPSITFLSPTNGSLLSSTVNLSASSSDNVAVAGVQFFYNSTPIGADITSTTSSPSTYSTGWNTAGVSDGSYTLSAVAEDTSGNYATSSVTVTVDNTGLVISTPVISSGSGGGSVSSAVLAALLSPGTTTTAYLNSINTIGPSLSTGASFNQALSVGSVGSEVRSLQIFLNKQGYIVAKTGPGSSGDETAYFGSGTKAALAKFQAAHNLPPTGYFGPLTMSLINVPADSTTITLTTASTVSTTASAFFFSRNLTIASKGPDVKALQQYLNSRGFIIAPSGPGSPGHETLIFGYATQAALARFQKAKGIVPASGYFGTATRKYVNSN